MSKREMRKRLAALSFSEKVKILEKLRDRSLALARSGLRQKAAGGDSDKPSKGMRSKSLSSSCGAGALGQESLRESADRNCLKEIREGATMPHDVK
jgi:hypothetical protein